MKILRTFSLLSQEGRDYFSEKIFRQFPIIKRSKTFFCGESGKGGGKEREKVIMTDLARGQGFPTLCT